MYLDVKGEYRNHQQVVDLDLDLGSRRAVESQLAASRGLCIRIRWFLWGLVH